MIKQLKTVREFRKSLRSVEKIISERITTETSCCGVTLGQCHIILELEMSPDISLNELSESLKLDKSTISRSIDSLVQDGLVNRTTPPYNRRSVKLSLTEKGEEKAGYINKICDDYYSNILHKIPEEDHPSVIEAMSKIEKALKTNIDKTKPKKVKKQ